MEVYGRLPIDLEQTTIPRGKVYLIPERCKECNICIQFCPRQVLRTSESTNCKGYHYPEIAPGMGAECVHCQFCSLVCPEFAIFTSEGSG
jgi:2-oxoglutarate ferredoxin oxidoreductase subunit delta